MFIAILTNLVQLVREAGSAMNEAEDVREAVEGSGRFAVFSAKEYASVKKRFYKDAKKTTSKHGLADTSAYEDASPVVTAQSQQSDTRLPGTTPATSQNGARSIPCSNEELQGKIDAVKRGLTKNAFLLKGLTQGRVLVTLDNFVSVIASNLGLGKGSPTRFGGCAQYV